MKKKDDIQILNVQSAGNLGENVIHDESNPKVLIIHPIIES